jgi:hypothetical protein
MPTFFDQLAIQNGASIFGRTIPNLLADMFGVINIFIVVTFSTGALSFALVGVNSVGGVVIFAILYGFFSGAGRSCLSFVP